MEVFERLEVIGDPETARKKERIERSAKEGSGPRGWSRPGKESTEVPTDSEWADGVREREAWSGLEPTLGRVKRKGRAIGAVEAWMCCLQWVMEAGKCVPRLFFWAFGWE